MSYYEIHLGSCFDPDNGTCDGLPAYHAIAARRIAGQNVRPTDVQPELF